MGYKNWNNKRLGEIITLKRGYDLPLKKRKKGNFPILSSSGISDYHDEFKVNGPGVTTGRSGLLGKVYFINEPFWPLNTSLYVEDFKGNDPKFIYYLLQTLALENFNAGSSVPTLNRNHVHLLEVKIPDVNYQIRIGEFLYNFEEKISLNVKIISNLEQLAQTLFNRWFVDFEFPNENGKPYKSSGGEMVESDLGMIPKEWEVKEIGEVIDFSYGKPLKKEDRMIGDYPVYGSNGIVDYHVTALVKGPGIIVGRKGNPGTVNYEEKDFYPIDTTFYITKKEEGYSFAFLYFMLLNQSLENLSADSAVPGLNRNHAYKNKFVSPEKDYIGKLDELINPLIVKKHLLIEENEKLANLRDTLLPKLLSGEIELPDETEVTKNVSIS